VNYNRSPLVEVVDWLAFSGEVSGARRHTVHVPPRPAGHGLPDALRVPEILTTSFPEILAT